ncbi:TPA: hypothetical protein ACIB1G_002660 [Salmonella enterica subsp. enterica serovar Saintpaul]
MDILAKKSGLSISGQGIAESDLVYVFHAAGDRRPTTVKKGSRFEKVFDGDFSIDDVFAWIDSVEIKK